MTENYDIEGLPLWPRRKPRARGWSTAVEAASFPMPPSPLLMASCPVLLPEPPLPRTGRWANRYGDPTKLADYLNRTIALWLGSGP